MITTLRLTQSRNIRPPEPDTHHLVIGSENILSLCMQIALKQFSEHLEAVTPLADGTAKAEGPLGLSRAHATDLKKQFELRIAEVEEFQRLMSASSGVAFLNVEPDWNVDPDNLDPDASPQDAPGLSR